MAMQPWRDPARTTMTVALLLGALVWAPAVSLPRAAADTNVAFFKSPSGNIECEIDFQRSGVPDGAYCMSINPPQHALIGPDGTLQDVCTNDMSCLSNGPEGEPVLAYGQSNGHRAVHVPFRAEWDDLHCEWEGLHDLVVRDRAGLSEPSMALFRHRQPRARFTSEAIDGAAQV